MCYDLYNMPKEKFEKLVSEMKIKEALNKTLTDNATIDFIHQITDLIIEKENQKI